MHYTKWKNIGYKNPSPEDLRQMYVYHEYFDAVKVALVYPGERSIISGKYYSTIDDILESECSIIKIPTHDNIGQWQENITNTINFLSKLNVVMGISPLAEFNVILSPCIFMPLTTPIIPPHVILAKG